MSRPSSPALQVNLDTQLPGNPRRLPSLTCFSLAGTIHADTGAVAAGPAGHGYVAPAAVVAATPAFVGHAVHTPTVYAGHAQTAGAIVSPGATLVGPSTDGRPGVVAANGYYGHGHGHGYGYPYGAGYHGIYGSHGVHGLIYG